jgi:hypothetical protein
MSTPLTAEAKPLKQKTRIARKEKWEARTFPATETFVLAKRGAEFDRSKIRLRLHGKMHVCKNAFLAVLWIISYKMPIPFSESDEGLMISSLSAKGSLATTQFAEISE